MDPKATESKATRLKAIEGALLLLLVQRIHPLFELGSSSLGFAAGIAFFLDGLKREALRVALLAKRRQLFLQLPCLLLPGLAVRLDLVALRFEVAESFFQRGSELLLGVEVFLYCADTGLLVFDNLGTDKFFAGVARAWRRDTTVGGRRYCR